MSRWALRARRPRDTVQHVPEWVSSARRRNEIVKRLQGEGFVEAARLSQELGVDSSTIRRDLAHLARGGLVKRTRGGAMPGEPELAVDIPYDVKRAAHTPEKTMIGLAAADLVAEGQTILLDSGSTTYQLALALRRRRGITVVTNDLQIAVRLAGYPGIRLVVAGGAVLESVYTLVGPQTLESLHEIHVDRTFLGADAIDDQVGITNINLVEVPVKRAMIEAADQTIVLADSSKFGRRSLARVAGLDEVHLVLTDEGLAPELRARYVGVTIRCVGTAPGGDDYGAASA